MLIQNMSARQLAKEAKVTHTSVTRFMNGEGGITLDTFLKMLDALGMGVKITSNNKMIDFLKSNNI